MSVSLLQHPRTHLISKYRLEISIFLLLAVGAFIGSLIGSEKIDPILLDRQSQSYWFESDIPYVFSNMTLRNSTHQRAHIHPLFAFLTYPAVFVLTKGIGMEAVTAVRLVIAFAAGLWLGCIFLLLRLSLGRILDALVFTLLAGFSAGAVFFFVVPETYPLGSLSILVTLLIVALAERREVSDFWFVLANVFSLGITITNWMVAIVATFICKAWKRTILIITSSLLIVMIIWLLQKPIFPAMGSFMSGTQEARYILASGTGTVLERSTSMIYHFMIMPAAGLIRNRVDLNKPVISTLHSMPGSGSAWGIPTLVLWSLLLIMGLYGLFFLREQPKLRLVLGLSLLGQLVLHLLYGTELFLYSLHFVPLLVLLAGLGSLTRLRWVSLAAASLVVIGTAANNLHQFEIVTKKVELYNQPRYQVRLQEQIRPEDPWPRDEGHVILTEPGSSQHDRAYHEPGGSFSPSVSSFGLSLWVTNREGELLRTSDDISLEDIDQGFVWQDGLLIPGILTRTRDYESYWSRLSRGNWRLNLKYLGEGDTRLSILIRGVGPAGGPVHSLKLKNERILVNDRWIVEVEPVAEEVLFGEEGAYNWLQRGKPVNHWESPFAWGFARIVLGEAGEWNIYLRDTRREIEGEPVIFDNNGETLTLEIPDDRFAASLKAQTAHLLMGLVESEVRPGDPVTYPHGWLREASYVSVALARAGQLDAAADLAQFLALTDFASGYGSQADDPGLAIWGLVEIAMQLDDPDFDKRIWPDVMRKAELILEMIHAEEPIYHDNASPLLPDVPDGQEAQLVANPAEDGWIDGRVGEEFPRLYVNAISYRGLMDAALLAERVNQQTEAQRFRNEAIKIQQAWGGAINSPQPANELVYSAGLWQSGIAEPYREAFRQKIQERWNLVHDSEGNFIQSPGSTFFEVADAHQWLLLGDRERSEEILSWFWDNQASPGLYTWWDDRPEENTLQEWDQVRGWVFPTHNTPQYWTAAEMLLLQMDMLAYTHYGEEGPVLVIGAGVPEKWLTSPVSVDGLRLREGKVGWIWDGSQIEIHFCGEPLAVELGPAFPANSPIQLRYTCP